MLIVGESGTGKEVLARLIHRASPRAERNFIAVNCAAIPENMLEAMLFGYEKGSFTGAHAAHAGKFEQAQGGTLLLDEITEMPLALQAKLLRVLQEKEVERIGGTAPVPLDVRVIATTNRLLRAEVAAGRFREDLYYRLNVFPLALSPLRDRRDDILPLATHLLAAALASRPAHSGAVGRRRAPAAHLYLARQRARAGQPAAARAGAGRRLGHRSPAHPVREAADAARRRGVGAPALQQTLERAERDVILEALRAAHGSRREVAEKLGISPRTLRYKLARIRNAGIEVPAA